MRYALFCASVVLVVSLANSDVSLGDDKEKFNQRDPEEIRKDIKEVRSKLASLETELSKAEAERPKDAIAIDWALIPVAGDNLKDANEGWKAVVRRYGGKSVSVNGTLVRATKGTGPRLLVCKIESPVARGEIKVNAQLVVEFKDVEQGPVIAKFDKPGVTVVGEAEARNGLIVIIKPRIVDAPPEKK